MNGTAGQTSLFVQAQAAADRTPQPRAREEFLTGLLATWLAGAGNKATKEQREHAQQVARDALAMLEFGS